MVGPTKLKPRFFKALLIACDSAVSAGMSDMDAHRFAIVLPPVKDQRNSSSEVPSACSWSTARAFAVKALILARFTDDAFIVAQFLGLCCVHCSNVLDIESFVSRPVALSTVQDRLPAQPGLSTLKAEQLEQLTVAMRRHAPLRVVVLDHQRAGFAAPSHISLCRLPCSDPRDLSEIRGADPTAETLTEVGDRRMPCGELYFVHTNFGIRMRCLQVIMQLLPAVVVSITAVNQDKQRD